MKTQRRRRVVVSVVAIVPLLNWGCAVKRVIPPSAETRAQLGVIGVSSVADAPKTDVTGPTRGGAAARGALAAGKTGAVAGALPGLGVLAVSSVFTPFPIVAGLLAAAGVGLTAAGGAAGGAVGGMGGAIYGAAKALPASKGEELALRKAVADLALQDALRHRVLEVARERTSLTFVALPAEPGLPAVGPGAHGAPDTILVVAFERLELTREGSEINAPVALTAVAYGRLIRTADGGGLYRHTLTYRSAARPFAEWAADDAQTFRGALIEASNHIAGEIVDVLFVRGAPAKEAEPAPQPLAAITAAPVDLGPAKEAELAPPPPAVITAAPVDLRTWLPGEWDTSGGATQLTISTNLSWDYTSTVRGRWRASGTVYVEDPDTVVLRGWFEGTDAIGRSTHKREPVNITLRRQSESLAGELFLSRPWPVTFSRAPRAAAKEN